MNIKHRIQQHPLVAYFALTFVITWGGILLVVGPRGFPGQGAEIDRLFPLVFLAMIAGPSTASIVLTAITEGRSGLRSLWARQCRWRVHIRWYGVALLTTPLLLIVIFAALTFWVSPTFVPTIIRTEDKIVHIIFAVLGGLVAGTFEEIGWTGFATLNMNLRQRGLGVAVALGLIWMVWHLLGDYWGLFNTYGSVYLLHVLVWFVALTAYRVLMTWVYRYTESLLVGQLMHASFTGSQILLGPTDLSANKDVLWYGIFAIALWVVVAVVCMVESSGSPLHDIKMDVEI